MAQKFSVKRPSIWYIHLTQAYGGMRGIKGLIYETSLLDAEEVPLINKRVFDSVVTRFQNARSCSLPLLAARNHFLKVSSGS
jgi:hypothetical protein